MAGGTIILRPCEDVDSTNLSRYPEDSDSLYILINEKICDYDSTYIYSEEKNAGSKHTSKYDFKISWGAFPANKIKITGLRACAYAKPNWSDKRTWSFTLIFDNVELTTGTLKPDNGNYTDYVLYEYNMANYNSYDLFINKLNNFIADKGLLPTDIACQLSFRAWHDDNSKSTDSPFMISQVYFEFDYEYLNIGLFKKKGDIYQAATNAYKKQNGTWSEIPEDEAKTILKNNTIRRG